MEQNELRIGNYLEMNTNPCIVVELLRFGAKRFKYVNGTEIFTDTHKELRPIKLTEQWLLKFGFEKTETKYYYEKQLLFEVHFRNGHLVICRNGLIDSMFISIKSVHQLQNLYFALTGEELIFTNP
jgi:hypothetical protein